MRFKSVLQSKRWKISYIIRCRRIFWHRWFLILTPFCNRKLYFHNFELFSLQKCLQNHARSVVQSKRWKLSCIIRGRRIFWHGWFLILLHFCNLKRYFHDFQLFSLLIYLQNPKSCMSRIFFDSELYIGMRTWADMCDSRLAKLRRRKVRGRERTCTTLVSPECGGAKRADTNERARLTPRQSLCIPVTLVALMSFTMWSLVVLVAWLRESNALAHGSGSDSAHHIQLVFRTEWVRWVLPSGK